MSKTPVHRTDRQRTQGETIILTVAAIVVGCTGIYMLHGLLAPAFFALTLVITVRPLVALASRYHVPRPISAVGAIILIYTFVIGLFAALGVAIAQLVETLPDYSAKFEAIWTQLQALLGRFGIDQSTLMNQVSGMLDTSRIVTLAQGMLSQVTSFGSVLMVMALTVVFLMFDMSRIELRARALMILKPEIAAALAGETARLQ